MFRLYRISLYYPRVIRSVSIFFIILRFGLVHSFSSSSFWSELLPAKYKRNRTAKPLPERLRMVIEELGPTFIKFGQILADRPDIVSERLRIELKKLQSEAQGFDDKIAIELIEEEMGGTIESYFSEFNRHIVGAASIGQVYKAKLKTGENVVVKIQRPNIESKIKLDLHILRYFAQQLVDEFPGLQAVDVIGVVDEFGDTLLHELNYLNEAGNAVRFAEMLKNMPYCIIPKVYMQYCTTKLIIMEDVSGVAPDDPENLIALGYNPKAIARHGSEILLEMIFKHGFFHADPHPGNLFIHPGDRIAFIDFGMVGSLKPSHLQFLAGFTLGLATTNSEILTDSLLTLCDKKYFADRESLEFSVHDMLMRYNAFNYEKINFSQMLNECVRIMLDYKLKLPGTLYILLKALATTEKFGYKLDPDISLPAIVKPYAEALVKDKFSAKGIATGIYEMLKDYGALVRDFPSEVNEILFRLKAGKLIHEIEINDKSLMTRSIKQFGGMLSMTVILSFMMIGSVAVNIWGHGSRMADIMFGVGLFFSVWLLFRLVFITRS